MNDNVTTTDKKKPGCFAIAGIFIIAWLLVCFGWAIIQTVSGTQHLPMHTADFVQLHVEDKINHSQNADQWLASLESPYLKRREKYFPFSYCFGCLLGESALLCPPFIGQVVTGMALIQERRNEGYILELSAEEREERAFLFGIIDVLGASFLIALPAFLIQRTITKKIRNKHSQKEMSSENESVEDIIVNDDKFKIRNIDTRKIKIILFVLGEIVFFILMALYVFGSHGHTNRHDWFSSAWLSICLGLFFLFVVKYVSNTIKKGIQFYKEEKPEKSLACFIIALLLVSMWILILNYGMCIFAEGKTFFYLLDKML